MIRLGRRATTAVINGLVNNMSEEVRVACAAVLAATRDPRALQALVDALDDPDGRVRYQAVRALGRVESRAATKRLLALLDKRGAPADLVDEAVRALGRLGDPAAVRRLLARFEKTWDPATQRALWDLRRRLAPAQIRRVVVGPLRVREDADPSPSSTVLEFSVERAGELRLRAATRPLIALLDRDESLQNRVVYNLGRIGDRAAVPALRGLLDRTAEARLLNNVVFALDRLGEDPKRDVIAQLHGAFLLATLGEKVGGDRLLEAIEDAPVYLKRVAARLLTELDLLKVEGLEARLVALLDNPDTYVRIYAARALLERGDARAFDRLWKELDKRVPFIRDEVLDVFERAPKAQREKFMGTWMAKADAHLRRDLRRIRARS